MENNMMIRLFMKEKDVDNTAKNQDYRILKTFMKEFYGKNFENSII